MKKKYTLASIGISIIILGLFVIAPSVVSAEEKCTFASVLGVGSVGEDVRCLQKFLNTVGFAIVESGPGSRGQETDTFGAKTKEALMKWQIVRGVLPATGYFGAQSKDAYSSSFITTTSTPGAPAVPLLTGTPLTTTVVPAVPEVVKPVTPVVTTSSAERKLKDLIKKFVMP
jgi:hypothetical protein